jgi:hypothetical protein
MSTAPITIRVRSPDGDEKLAGVQTWWYDGGTLNVEHLSGEVRSFPNGNVIERLL